MIARRFLETVSGGPAESAQTYRRNATVLLLCVLIGIFAFSGGPRAQGPAAAFHAVGDLAGGGVGSAVRDATRVNGTIYAVGASTTASTATPPNVPQLDTPALWTWPGSGNGTLTALPPGTGVSTNGSAGAPLSAYDITASGSSIASQARFLNSGTGTRWVRVDRSLLTAADPAVANLDISGTAGIPVAFAALAISDGGGALYGQGTNVDGTRTPRRYEAGVGVNTVDMTPTGKTWGFPIPRGTSTDGLVMVGYAADGFATISTGVAPNFFLSTNTVAFRYDHNAGTTTGATTAIRRLSDSGWNMPVALSANGNQTVVIGNSADYPNGEVYLTDASNAITATLGSPNTRYMPRPLGGMTADGSVVAVTFAGSPNFGPSQIGGLGIPTGNLQAYVHNSHGWFPFSSVLAAQGIDLVAMGWFPTSLAITGVHTVEGVDLVFGQGRRQTVGASGYVEGAVEGFVAELPAGVMAAFNPAPTPPVDTAIVGAWGFGIDPANPLSVHTYLADGTGVFINSVGFERALYSWAGNPAGGALLLTTLNDTNGGNGQSGFNGFLGRTATVAGDTLTYTDTNCGSCMPLTLTRIVGGPGSIVGGWVGGNPALPDNSFVFAIAENKYFVMNDFHDVDKSEEGTYTWDRVSHELIATVGGVVDTGNFVTVSPDGLSLHVVDDEGENFTLTRVIDPTTIPVITNSHLSASGVAGQPFSYDVAATNTVSFTATGLPDGLSINSRTGQISGTPSVAGQFAVTISASSAIGVSDIKTLTLTLSIERATPIITWTTPAAITYGTMLNGTQLNATADVPGTFDYTPAAGALLGAGPAQALTATFTPDDQTAYTPATATVVLTVQPAVLLVTPNDQTRWTGAPNPTFTYTLSGFVLGDTVAVISGAPTLTTTAGATSPAGAYPITATLGTLAGTNYTFTFATGTLTVELSPCDPAYTRPIDDITTFVGSGAAGFSGGGFGGDEEPPTSALMRFPNGVAVGGGFIYIADTNNHRVRRVNLATCTIDTVAGSGTAGFAGDGGAATAARLNAPRGVAVADGILYIADTNNHRVRRVDLTTGIITTVAGSGDFTFGGDGGPATSAGINGPFKVTVANGGLFVADRGNHRIRRVELDTGVITTIAGNGSAAFAGDGGAATSASLNFPTDMVVGSNALFIADRQNARVRRVDLTTGTITTVAGNGTFGASGIGPAGLASKGTLLFISDDATPRVRQLDLTTGVLSTVAGTGVAGFSGDAGPGTTAQVDNPSGLTLTPGALFIADTFNQRVRRLQLKADQAPLIVDAPASAVFGTTFTASVTGGNGTGAVTVSVTGVCTNTAGGADITMTGGAGDCTITATRAGDAEFYDATSTQVVVSAIRAPQATLSIEGAPENDVVIGTSFVVSVAGGSGLGAVNIEVTGACENNSQDPALVTITASTGTCTISAAKAGDDNYLDTASTVIVNVADSIAPVMSILSPDRESLITASPAVVTIDASDIAGVASVTVNGVVATLASGTAMGGRWQAVVPVDLMASALTFTASATDTTGNMAAATAVLDNDGIANAIDRGRNDYASDQSGTFSLQFNDGVTSGVVTGPRQQYTISKPAGSTGVRVSLVGTGTVDTRFCNGADKYVRLDATGESADASCNSSTVTVTAVAAAPAISVYKPTTGIYYQSYTSCSSYRCGFFRTCTSCYTTTYPVTYTYYYRIDLATGQTVSTGSPVVADPANTSPLLVTLVQVSDDGFETEVGTFELDPGESAEVTAVTPGPNRQDTLELTVLEGQVTVTINGEETVLDEGAHPLQRDLTPPVCALSSSAPDPTANSPIPVLVSFTKPVIGFEASAVVVTNGTISNFVGAGSTFTFVVTPSGLGDVTVTIPAAAAADVAGNVNVVPAVLMRTFVAKQNQAVSFDPIPDAGYGTGPLTLTATTASGLPVSYAATGSCSVSGSTLSLLTVGVCSVTASQSGNDLYHPAADVVRSFSVVHTWSGMLQPINQDGTSLFKTGSTIPVKFQLTEGSSALTNLAARLYLSHVSNGVTGSELEATSTAAADSGNVFRYADGQYIINLSTTGMQQGTWQLRIDLLDGVVRTVMISLKK